MLGWLAVRIMLSVHLLLHHVELLLHNLLSLLSVGKCVVEIRDCDLRVMWSWNG